MPTRFLLLLFVVLASVIYVICSIMTDKMCFFSAFCYFDWSLAHGFSRLWFQFFDCVCSWIVDWHDWKSWVCTLTALIVMLPVLMGNVPKGAPTIAMNWLQHPWNTAHELFAWSHDVLTHMSRSFHLQSQYHILPSPPHCHCGPMGVLGFPCCAMLTCHLLSIILKRAACSKKAAVWKHEWHN